MSYIFYENICAVKSMNMTRHCILGIMSYLINHPSGTNNSQSLAAISADIPEAEQSTARIFLNKTMFTHGS